MADIVDLRTRSPVTHDDEFNSQLVQDLARYSEGGLITEKEIRRRYQFDEATWNALGENESLFAAIEDEKVRRIRNGQQKRERSQKLVTQAPDVAASIMLNDSANDRHRLDACKVLNDFSANGPEAAPAADRFVITINLGADTMTFNKSIRALEPNEIDPHDSSPDTGMLAALAAKKTESGGGENTL